MNFKKETTKINKGHKHGDDICGNFRGVDIDEECEACVLTAIEDLTKLKMNFEKHRLESFYKWPIQHISVKDLARCGFYYSGKEDKVRCNFCKVEIYEWAAKSNPFVEHLKWSPFCKLLNNKTNQNKNL